MLIFSHLIEAVVQQQQQNQNPKPAAGPNPNKPKPGQIFSANDAAKIIDRNSDGPDAKAIVNIDPSSASKMMNSNSASSAASRYGNQAANAGAQNSALTSAYVNKPTRSTSRSNINPTVSANSI